MKNIPRIVVAATQSGAGKTTIVTGLLAALRQQGLQVQSFKAGPDYIDPGYHALASGRPAHNLDSWLTAPEILPEILATEAAGADIAIIEGVMGLYDGGRQGISSTAEIAKILKAPVLLVIDAKSMGASAAAIALGFREYDKDVNLAGVIINRLGSDTHEALVREAMAKINMPVYGALRRDDGLSMPERHLGLVPVEENQERAVVAHMGEVVAKSADLDKIIALARSAAPLPQADTLPLTAGQYNEARKCPQPQQVGARIPKQAASISPTSLKRQEEVLPMAKLEQRRYNCRIGVAKDEAFSFYYPASLKVLERLGAEIVTFSPLHDHEVPPVDGLLIGGGFPEMFAAQLAANTAMRQALYGLAQKGMPILAECGGYMYMKESLQDFAGNSHAMVGALPGRTEMTAKLQMVGYVEAELTADSVLGGKGEKIRGHEFHFSQEQAPAEETAAFIFRKLRNNTKYPAGRRFKNVLGSYLHLHFAGCPQAAVNFVSQCAAYRQKRGQDNGKI